MSFSPLPVEIVQFLKTLSSQSHPRILDLGSGQGDFSQLLNPYGVPVWGLDRLPTAAGVKAHLQGDALDLPVLPASLDCLLAGNLVRHLLIQCPDGSFLKHWLDFLRPGGCIFLFEDEPEEDSAATRNYHELQNFLAKLMPSHRGPLLPRSKFCSQVRSFTPEQQWNTGLAKNQESPDTSAVLAMLRGGSSSPRQADGQAGQLISRIEKYGLSYGSYWWAQACIH